MSAPRTFHVSMSRLTPTGDGQGWALRCTCGNSATGRTRKAAQRAHSFHVAQQLGEALS